MLVVSVSINIIRNSFVNDHVHYTQLVSRYLHVIRPRPLSLWLPKLKVAGTHSKRYRRKEAKPVEPKSVYRNDFDDWEKYDRVSNGVVCISKETE